MAQRVV